jgi:hypothetical protein
MTCRGGTRRTAQLHVAPPGQAWADELDLIDNPALLSYVLELGPLNVSSFGFSSVTLTAGSSKVNCSWNTPGIQPHILAFII